MALYKSFGLLSIVLLWAGLFFMVKKWPGNKSMSYSRHAATSMSGIIYYFLIFGSHLILFYLFVSQWFVPTFQLPSLFTKLTIAAVLGQLVALIIPTTGGWKTKVHDLTAYTMFILLMPMSLLIFQSQHIAMTARVVALITACYMVGVWFLFALTKTANKYHLIVQTIYGLSFHSAILLAVYVR